MTALVWPLLLVFAGLGLLFLGGEGLVKSSSSIALRFGLSPLVAGLTVVAFGTSAPELVVSVQAASEGRGGIAVGNAIGSNILNIGLILGITAIISPLRVKLRVVRLDVPLMIGTSLAALLVLLDGHVSRGEGAALLAGLLAYTAFTVFSARRDGGEGQAKYAASVAADRGSLTRDVLWLVGGLVLLVSGSRLLVNGAVTIARQFGLSEAVIGLTIVAVGTSMPELATCLVAAVRREADIALGNIVGSNIFNTLGILGVAALVSPLAAKGIELRDLLVMIGFSLALLPIIWTGFQFERWEGAVLVIGYLSYTAALWPK